MHTVSIVCRAAHPSCYSNVPPTENTAQLMQKLVTMQDTSPH